MNHCPEKIMPRHPIVPLVVALLAGFLGLRPIFVRLLRSAQDQAVHWQSLTSPASYVIGIVASYWLIDRVAAFWG